MAKIQGFWGKQSFNSVFKDYKVIAQKDLFIKVLNFETPVSVLEKYQASRFNLFEEAILKFSLIDIFSSEEIAESLCMEYDLIKLIKTKLYRRIRIDDGDKNAKLKQFAEKYFEKQEENVKRETINFNYILPVVTEHYNYIEKNVDIKNYRIDDTVDYDTADNITCSFGNAGTEFKLCGYCVNPQIDKSVSKTRPTQSEFMDSLRKNNKFSDIIFDKSTPININLKGESIYFHYKLVLLENSNDVIITDGYHLNDSVLIDFIKNYYPNYIQDLYKKVNVNTVTAEDSEDKDNSPINNPIQKSGDKKIAELMFPPTEFAKGKKRDDISYSNNKLLANYYSAIEWALFYNLKNNPIDKAAIDELAQNGYEENGKYITQIFYYLFNIDVSQYFVLFQTSKTNINRYVEENTAEMNNLLPLMVLQAQQINSSLFYNLIKEFPDCIYTINKLRYHRNNYQHGGENLISYEEILEFYDFTRAVIKIISPSNSTEKDTANIIIDDDKFEKQQQEKLNNITHISHKMGVENYHNLNKFNQNKLLEITKFYNKTDGYNFITNIYSLLQRLLQDYAKDYLNVFNLPENIDKSSCIDIFNSDEFYKGNCPASFKTVRIDMVERALNLENSSLGAYMLVVTLLSHTNAYAEINAKKKQYENDVEKFEKRNLLLGRLATRFNRPNISLDELQAQATIISNKLFQCLEFVDECLSIRHHGNEVGLTLSKAKMKEIYNELFNVIKLIGEI